LTVNETPQLTRGTQIAYVPQHVQELDNDLTSRLAHPDVEFGFVTSGPTYNNAYFCRYWRKGHLGDLRTKSCSEGTPFDCIVVIDSVPQVTVDLAMVDYCYC
jgi:hypothetical protein